MLRELTSRQLLQWMDYESVHPFEDLRGDIRAASVCAAIANFTMIANRSKKRFRVSDFLLEFGVEKEVEKEEKPVSQSWQQMKLIAMMCVADSRAKRR